MDMAHHQGNFKRTQIRSPIFNITELSFFLIGDILNFVTTQNISITLRMSTETQIKIIF